MSMRNFRSQAAVPVKEFDTFLMMAMAPGPISFSPVLAGVPTNEDAFNFVSVHPHPESLSSSQQQCLQSVIHDDQEETVGEYINNSDKLLVSLRNLFNNPEISDITILVGSKKYHAHKVILAHSSDVFKVMLMSDKWKDADQGEIQLEDTQCEAVFGQFLEYLYTGKVHITTDKAVPLLILADKYNVPELKESWELS
ncbi:BTB/POZ domain-containing protein 17-like isoform X1 [Ptychodera flava]|uniref:BTB/POZ domain-containing protein 17-like isoform X1 n=1 Tax=Ptychodera flava TaxID=63121 RepID=UPI00396A00EF